VSNDIVFVLGHPRTGSSALTRVLSLCGCTLPPAIFGADENNPRGFWEPSDAANLNLRFLMRHRSDNGCARSVEPGGRQADENETFVHEIRAFLRACPHGSPLVIKEPLINDVIDFWLEAARFEEGHIKVVICVRHPEESFLSVGGPSALPREQAMRMWLRVALEVERCTRDIPRVFVEYSNLLKDWRFEVDRISRSLSMDLRPMGEAIDKFITPDLHRHRFETGMAETSEDTRVAKVYEILFGAAQGKSVDVAALDEIYREYSPTAPRFGVVPEEWFETLVAYFKIRPIWRSGQDF